MSEYDSAELVEEEVQDVDLNIDKALEERIVILNDKVDRSILNKIWLNFEFLSKTSKSDSLPIEFHINSEGGNLFDALFICDYMRSSLSPPIHTIGTGFCQSSAFLLLICGIERFCYSNTLLMMHDLSPGSYETDLRTLLSYTEALEHYREVMIRTMVEQSNLDREFILSKIDKKGEWYIKAEEAKEYGLVDELITPEFRFNNKKDWI